MKGGKPKKKEKKTAVWKLTVHNPLFSVGKM